MSYYKWDAEKGERCLIKYGISQDYFASIHEVGREIRVSYFPNCINQPKLTGKELVSKDLISCSSQDTALRYLRANKGQPALPGEVYRGECYVCLFENEADSEGARLIIKSGKELLEIKVDNSIFGSEGFAPSEDFESTSD